MKSRLSTSALVLAASLAGALTLASCSGEDDAPCLTTTRFFAQRVWGPTIAKKCIHCHTLYGLAKDSAFLLQDESNPDFISHNLAIVAGIAELEKDGASLLLQKASGGLAHGGGVQVAKGSDEYATVEELVRRLGEPDPCEGAANPSSIVQYATLLDGVLLLRKASMSLASRWPTDAEEEAVRSGGEAALDAVLLKMMTEDAFYERLKEIWNDYLLTDVFVPMPDADDPAGYGILPAGQYADNSPIHDFPNVAQVDLLLPEEKDRLFAGVAVAREPLELIAHVVRTGRPFTEILTADYTVVNPYSAVVYGVEKEVGFADPKDPTEYRKARLHITRGDGEEQKDIPVAHAGVLTTNALMSRWATTATNRNRTRANAILSIFLGINARKLAERTIDPTRVTGHNPTMNHADCTVCHTVLDPVAGAFKQWPYSSPGKVARYMPADGGNPPESKGDWPPAGSWFSDMRPPGLGAAQVPQEQWNESERWLGTQMATDRRFALNVVHKMYTGLTGRPPIPFPESPDAGAELNAWEVQSELLNGIADAFVEGGYDLRTVILGIVKSPYYRAVAFRGTETADRSAELRDVGTGRLLTPEMLDRKIEAVTGLAWSPASPDKHPLSGALLDLGKEKVRWSSMYYGGHEGGTFGQRVTSMSSFMANYAARMANEMSCFATTWDFMHAAGERRLFPHVELSDTPADSSGAPRAEAVQAIKRNLAHLYRRVWGIDVAEDSAEVEEAFALFSEVWAGGVVAVKEEREEPSLPCPIEHQPGEAPEVPLEAGVIPIQDDTAYTVRAWMAVLTYLLSDYTFLYE